MFLKDSTGKVDEKAAQVLKTCSQSLNISRSGERRGKRRSSDASTQYGYAA